MTRRHCIIGAMVSLTAISGPAQAETLLDAVQAAFRTNPQVNAQRTGAEIAREQLKQARGARRPTVDLSGSYGFRAIETSVVFAPTFGDQGIANAQATAVQPVFTSGAIGSGIRQARAGVGAEDARLDGVQQDIVLQAVTAYVDVQADSEAVRIQKTSIELLTEQVEAATARFEVGEVTRTDVAQAEARLETALADLAAAEAQLEASRAVYAFVVGAPPGELAPVPPAPQLPATIEEATEVALENNPDIVAARLDEISAKEAVTGAESALLPQVQIIGTASLEETFFEGQVRNTNLQVVAQATVPFYEGGVLRSQVRAAKLSREAARQQVALLDRQVRAQMASAWYQHIASLRQILASERRVTAAEMAFEGAVEELAVGVRTTLDTLDQEQELLEARLALVQAERDAYVAAYNVLEVAGAVRADLTGF